MAETFEQSPSSPAWSWPAWWSGRSDPKRPTSCPAPSCLLATAVSLRLAPAPTDSTDVTEPTELVPSAVTL